MEPERIIVSKNDEPTLVAEKLIDTEAGTVVFIIPQDCEFAQSKANFKLLKREAEVLKKKVFIESPDQEVLDIADLSGLETISPTVLQPREVSDVVKVKISAPARLARGARVAGGRKQSQETIEVASKGQRQKRVTVTPLKNSFAPRVETFIGEPIKPPRQSVKISRRAGFWIIASAIALAGVIYLAMAILPRATIAIETKKEPWQFTRSILVDTAVSTTDSVKLKVPGQLFIQKGSAVTKQPATGKKYLERKATGKLTVYNAYSSKPQGLVVNTRFVTPDGVVFRLTSPVTVPGADIENGVIVPSSITVNVAADKAGPSGNVGSVEKLTIPGFTGSPKYQGFYGELKEGTTGGLIGTTSVPTENDLLLAKTEGRKAAEAAVRNQSVSQIPDGFKTVPEATRFTVLRQDVNSLVDENGDFSVTTAAQLSALAFREKDILALLHELAKKEKGEQYQVDSENLEYVSSDSIGSPATGQLALPIEYEAQLSQTIDITALTEQMKGQDEQGIKAIIYGLPGVTSAKISLWPFWVRHVPVDVSKVKVTVE